MTAAADKPTVAIIQARMTSTRLPGKVLADICGQPVLARLAERLRRAARIDRIVLATTTNADDDPVAALAAELGLTCFRGSEHDVRSRYVGAAAEADAGTVVRVTGDCPLIDPAIIDRVVGALSDSGADYAANILERSYPIGMDVEAFRRAALDRSVDIDGSADAVEHVTPGLYRHPEKFTLESLVAPDMHRDPDLRLTLDTPEDLDLIRRIFGRLYTEDPAFDLMDILAMIAAQPELRGLNADVPHRWVSMK